ncbi:MAG: response regulator transcription factor [Frankiales bacterium]|jgi:DNA-binding NarL/FixJ family response regulator|nr:response regulator transcription factor [Frankiales bacterium]
MAASPSLMSSVPGHDNAMASVSRVLVAMEHRLFCEALKVALSARIGYEVTSARPDHALSAALLRRPDVVILELEGERENKLELVRGLRAALPETAVLVISDAPSAALLSAVMAAGAAGFLSLDEGIADVVSAVCSAAEGQVVLSGHRLASLVRQLARHAPPVQPSGPGGRLTERELEVLELLVRGASTSSIAATLVVSAHTARTHAQNVLLKLGVHSRLEAVAYATQHGLVPPAWMTVDEDVDVIGQPLS